MNCVKSVRSRTDFVPKIAIVLGSGLGEYADTIKAECILPYTEIEGFPRSTVEGHRGRFIFGRIEGIPVVVMQGRVHYYEGYSMQDVVLPARLMGKLGAEVLLLTNASGSVNTSFGVGDFMLITDHISSLIPSPLIGPNIPELGVRFPDMSKVYDPALCDIIIQAAKNIGIPLRTGTYIQLTGPNFETPAEIRTCRVLGTDAAGMSTVCEAIAAHHMGMRVCGISSITNLGCGISDAPLSHAEVFETAERVAPIFRRIITESVLAIAEVF